MIALGAQSLDGKGGERTEPVEDFLAGDRTGRLVLELEYDKPSQARGRHSRCGAGTRTPTRSRTLRSARPGTVSASVCPASGPVAVRARAVEQAATKDVLKDVDPVDDAVATAEYRRKMLTVLVRRALDEVES